MMGSWTREKLGVSPHNGQTNHSMLVYSGGGSIKLTSWFQGCGLNALEQLNCLNVIPETEWKSFAAELRKTGTRSEGGGTYNPRRWLFTVAMPYQTPQKLFAELVKHSRKIDEFPNWAHGPSDICMYILEFPE